MVSKEFELGLGLIEKFSETLEQIASSSSEEEAQALIESIRHPILGAMAQIKNGEGPLREEMLESLSTVVAQMRKLTDLGSLRSSIKETLNLVKEARKMIEEPAQAKEGG